MQQISTRDARHKIRELLDAAERGEETIILRRGRPVARIVPFHVQELPSRAKERNALRPARTSTAQVVRALRDEDRA